MRKLVIILLLLSSFHLFAQEEEINVAGLVFLDYGGDMPSSLFDSKSVVLVATPPVEGESIRQPWKPLAETAHESFVKAGFNPVAYYFFEDVLAGKESREAFSNQWKKREIKNIIVLSKALVAIKNKPGIRYVVMTTTFNQLPSLMGNGQKAWKAQSKSLDKVLDKVSKAGGRHSSKNKLVNDVPEFFDDANIIKGQHVEGYLTDLDFGKLAVPRFPMVNIPGNRPGGIINNQVEKQVKKANEQSRKNNVLLKSIMDAYKYKYEFTDPQLSDQELMDNGFSYALYSLHTSGVEIKRLLDYEIDETDETYMTLKIKNGKQTLSYIPVKAPVYKFYIKHLKSGNVYLGKNWDADELWTSALKNLLMNVAKEMNR